MHRHQDASSGMFVNAKLCSSGRSWRAWSCVQPRSLSGGAGSWALNTEATLQRSLAGGGGEGAYCLPIQLK